MISQADYSVKTIGFFILVFFSIFQFPLFFIGGDSVGLFDFYLILYFCVLAATSGFQLKNWRKFLFVFMGYLGYLGFSLIISLSPASTLLLIKQLEYFILIIVVIDFFNTTSVPDGILLDLLLLIMLSGFVYQLLYVNKMVPGFGAGYRLGLPLTEGVSSNPAGLILGSIIIVIIELALLKHGPTFFRVFALIVAAVSMWLTISRTNMLGLIMALGISVVIGLWKSKKGRIVLILLSLMFLLFYFFVLKNIPRDTPYELFFKLLRDPSQIFLDNSFKFRLFYHWPNAIKEWLSSPFTILFGKGLGKVPVVDGLYFRLLLNQGLIGFLLFIWLWFYFPLKKFFSKGLVVLLFFIVINGITAETLLISYRSVQIYIVLLFVVCFLGSSTSRNTEKQNIEAL